MMKSNILFSKLIKSNFIGVNCMNNSLHTPKLISRQNLLMLSHIKFRILSKLISDGNN